MRYDSILPEALIGALLASDHKTNGHPTLLPEQRDETILWLRRVLTDFDAFEAHVHFLREHMNDPSRSRRREQDRNPETPFRSLYLDCRHNCPLEESLAFAVARQGLEVLAEATLAQLVLNPAALDDLAMLIQDHPSGPWRTVLAQVGSERMATQGRTILPRVAAPAPASIPQGFTEDAVSGRLPTHKRETLRQILTDYYPDLRDRIDKFLTFVEERFPKLPDRSGFGEAIPRLYDEFSRR